MALASKFPGQNVLLRAIKAQKFKCSAITTAPASVEHELDHARPFEEIPGPKPLPLLGNSWRFLPFIGKYSIEEIDKAHLDLYETYGKITKFSKVINKGDIVFLFDPKDIEKVYRQEGSAPRRPAFDSLKYYRKVARRDFYGDVGGLLVDQGKSWQDFRSKVQQPMMRPQMVQLYSEHIDIVAKEFIGRIRSIRNEKNEVPESFRNELYKWALESIALIALDTRLGCLNPNLDANSEPQKMIVAAGNIMEAMGELELRPPIWKIFPTSAWKRFASAHDYFTEIAVKYINRAMQSLAQTAASEDKDRELTLLERLLARDTNSKTALVMALDMMLAGIDTTSHSLGFLLYHLASNPEKQQILFKELQTHLPTKDSPLTSNILEKLSYLRCCLKESMRLNSIVSAHARVLEKDIVLSGYRVPKGKFVVLTSSTVARREDIFREALKFVPERWMSEERSQLPPPFTVLPFSYGTRMCIGRRFAELEIKTITSRIVRNFEIEFHHGEIKSKSRFVNMPDKPLQFTFIDRNN